MEKEVLLFISIRLVKLVNIVPNTTGRNVITIKMREDELPLLEEVKRFFNCGNIYLQKDKRLNHRNCYRFEISSLQKITEVVIPFFQKYRLHSVNRKNDFNLFCRIFEILRNKNRRSLTGEELEKIRKLKSQMHSA